MKKIENTTEAILHLIATAESEIELLERIGACSEEEEQALDEIKQIPYIRKIIIKAERKAERENASLINPTWKEYTSQWRFKPLIYQND